MNAQSARDLDAMAADWVARIDREGRHAALLHELNLWLSEDARREGALLRAEAAWAMLGSAMCSTSVIAPQVEEPDDAGQRWWQRPKAWVTTGLAAAFVVTISLSTLGGQPDIRYATAVGEVRRVPLADGSIASINSDADVAITVGSDRRTAEIRRGEAWFQVARDKRRPFTVHAGRVRVQAVGTAFAVHRLATGAEILVTEGVVEAWADGAEGHRIRLRAGQRAFVANNAAIREIPAGASEVDRALSWRAGKLDLAGETLDHAIAQLNRYNARKLTLASPALGKERLYGIFRTDDPEGFANTVAASLDMTVEMSGDTITLAER